MTNSAFYIEDMTNLRYAISFIKTAKKLLNEDVLLIYDDVANTHKYNSIKRHRQRFQKICEENDVTSTTQREVTYIKKLKIKNLFCVENTAHGIEHENYYSFQHAFDYTGLYQKVKHATYIVNEQYFKTELEKLGLKAIIQPMPVVFWDWESQLEIIATSPHVNEKIVTMFYPEEGHRELFQRVKDKIESLGYRTYIKQRTKNQSVPASFECVFYDYVWYPSESIFLPIISDFSVGFGTTAYIDIVHANKLFIDLSIPDYSKKYYKPSRTNFVSIPNNFYENFCKLNFVDIALEEKLVNPCDYEKIKSFLLQVLK